MHNLTLTDMNIWDPNENFGDMQLISLASWMTHEEVRTKELNKLMEKEEK